MVYIERSERVLNGDGKALTIADKWKDNANGGDIIFRVGAVLEMAIKVNLRWSLKQIPQF